MKLIVSGYFSKGLRLYICGIFTPTNQPRILFQLYRMSQKLAIQTWRLVQPKEATASSDSASSLQNKKYSSRNRHKVSLVEKAQLKRTRDLTARNLKVLTKKDYRKADELKRNLLYTLTNTKKEEDFIKLEEETKNEQDEELEKDLDSFVAEYFGDASGSKTGQRYKSRNVLRREKEKKDRERFSVERLPGCSLW